MNIPNFINSRVIDENGYFTPEWRNLMTQMLTEQQINLGNEGYKIPQQPTTNINNLTDVDKSTASIVYDSTTNTFKGNEAGVWKTFTLV